MLQLKTLMPRLASHAAALVSVLAFAACGSGSDEGRPGAGGSPAIAGAGGGGDVNAGASGGAAGSAETAGQSSIGGGGGSASTAGMAGGGSSGGGGGGGGSTPLTGTPLVYVGGFGDFPLRVYELNKATGALTQRGSDVAGGRSPSYLALSPRTAHLYAANEENGLAAGVRSFEIGADGGLTPLNQRQGSDQSCDGACGFTHVALDPAGKLLVAASYAGGSVSVFPVEADGSLGAEKSLREFGGQSYAHAAGFEPSGRFAFVPTKGLHRVQQLKLAADGALAPNQPDSVASRSGAGPRHIARHPNGKLMLVMNETDSTVTSYALAADGTLSSKVSASSLPAGFQGESYGQHVEVSPDGRFVYGSNVGHDSIAVFSLAPDTGMLALVQNQATGGAWPRDFAMDPNGEVLVVANRDSSTLTVLKIGPDGRLSRLGAPTTVPAEPSAVVIRYQK
ncbi:MAG: hypothetical protein K0R38_1876 [Polyangiaceae bacterium]|nr:hypothetical protein [Polyangiaceae bacterium]